MPVSDQHKSFIESNPLWTQVKDCVKGSSAVKARQAGTMRGDAYLPVPNPLDTSDDNASRFAAYLYRANYTNFTGFTKKGMVGMVFRRETKVDLPDGLDYLETNINGGGLSLNQLIKSVLGDILEAGRYGLLVEYPEIDTEGMTKAEIDELELQANIQSYSAQNIINWRTTVINGKKKLSLVVLQESKEELAEDGFSSEMVVTHRVLKLIDGVYIQEVWGKDDTVESSVTPTKSDGSTWGEIPFVFVGSENNDETVDEAPLYDLSNDNLGHYRNSADYEESCFMVGQPTPVITGLDENWYKKVLKKEIKIGSRGGIPLPVGGDAKLMQAEPNQMPAEGMKDKERRMLMTGARLIQDAKGNETAEAAKIRNSGQNSQLAGIVGNIEDGIEMCVGWAGEYMAVEVDQEKELVTINRQFYDANMDAQQAMALIQFADRGDISQTDVRGSLRRAGWVDSDKSDEAIDEELEDLNLELTDDDEKELSIENKSIENATEQTTDPALVALLEKLISQQEQKQTFIPAGEGGENVAAPVITVEAPVVNVTLPEGLITLPENMVQVTVEAPQVTVESPEINSPVNVLSGMPDKEFDFQYAADGKTVIGGGLRVVKDSE